jgi:hypothetical protein
MMSRARLTEDLLSPTVDVEPDEPKAHAAPSRSAGGAARHRKHAGAQSEGRRITRASELGPPLRPSGRPPAPDIANVRAVPQTVYLRPDQVVALRQLVEQQRTGGLRSDVSMLVREAIDRLLAAPAK